MVDTVLAKRRGMGGLLLHTDGGVVLSGRSVLYVGADGQRVLADIEGVAGFNDMTTDADGAVWAGALKFNPFSGEDPVPGDVWRISSGGRTQRAGGGLEWPNGMAFSADGRTFYASDYAHAVVFAYEVLDDGLLSEPRPFARMPSGSCDGLAVAEDGSVWVALGDAGGIGRFGADGEIADVLDVPASFVTSLAFGGEDMRDLYVTTANDGTLLRTRADRPGLPVPRAAV
jgi:gluconolactonase